MPVLYSRLNSMTTLLQIPDAMTAPAAWPPAGGIALDRGYPYDPFQQHAILGIEAGDDVFVTAKTGSGKTAVGEYLIARALKRGERVFYTTPIKSLSNQKYHDLKKQFPTATVGILTGDIKMCPDAQIVVMTAEILRNLLYKRGTATEGVGLSAAVSLDGVTGIVMDEVHYIQDPDRGHVWEETIILCPKTIMLVLLSATLPSASSLAGWMATQREKRTWLLSTTFRVVPLTHAVLSLDNKVIPLISGSGSGSGGWNPDGYASWIRERKALEDAAISHKKAVDVRRRDGYSAPPPSADSKARVESPTHRLHRCVSFLETAAKMPALFFVFSRKKCEEFAALLPHSLLDGGESSSATHIFDFHLSRFRPILERSGQYPVIRGLIQRGIAFHHSGLLPLLKEIVEILFTRGFIKVLFATETFSVGLNMPTKTVIFLELGKFSDGGVKRLLRTDEYTQMAGRAGRRGLDKEGLVLYHPLNDPIEPIELRNMITGSLPPLCSQMRFHYDFILKQHLSGSLETDLASRSYWAAQQKASRVAEGEALVRLEASLVGAAAAVSEADRAAFAEEARLEALVKSTKNAARQRALKERGTWAAEHVGPAWDLKRTRLTTLLDLQKQVAAKETELAAWDEAPLLSLEPQETFLQEAGFLDRSTGSLTSLGLASTEINEGHPLLMTLLAASNKCDSLTGEDVACILACFLREGGSDEEPALHSLDLKPECVTILEWLGATIDVLYGVEERLRISSPREFWNLSSRWVAITREWLSGASLASIGSRWGLLEGNVQRALLRIANILEEWTAVATLQRNLPMLEKMASVRLLRDEIVVDSLYLRI